MKVKARPTVLREIARKDRLINDMHHSYKSIPTGQLCLHLGYDIMTYPGLRDEFKFDDVSAAYYQDVIAKFRREYCERSKMSEAHFNETYQIDFDVKKEGVHIFKIMTEEDRQQEAQTVAERITKALEEHADSPKAGVMIVHETPEGAMPTASKAISRIVFAIEPLEVYCRDVMPSHIIEAVNFANKYIRFDAYYVAFITQEDALSTWSPKMVVAKLGPHYFVEIGRWR